MSPCLLRKDETISLGLGHRKLLQENKALNSKKVSCYSKLKQVKEILLSVELDCTKLGENKSGRSTSPTLQYKHFTTLKRRKYQFMVFISRYQDKIRTLINTERLFKVPSLNTMVKTSYK